MKSARRFLRRPIRRRSTLALGSLLILLAGIAACARMQPVSHAQSASGAAGWDQVPAILARIQAPAFPDRDFDVTRYGAVADGKTLCTDAFRKAIEACAAAGGGRVVVPAGRFLTGAIHLKSNVNLHLVKEAVILFSTDPKDYLPVVFTRWEGVECMNYSPLIYAFEQKNVAVTGAGTLDGQADNTHWWPWKGKTEFGFVSGQPNQDKPRSAMFAMAEQGIPPEQRVMGDGHYLRPSFIEPYRCQNVLIEGVTIVRSPFWEIHPTLCRNVTVRGVSVISHGPNNDGCDPESCSDVLIENCLFDTGDDCIALKSGRNADGRRLGVPIENVVIRGCKMKDGHGGVVIGSEISGGARNVFAEDCEMDSPNLDRVLRIKSNSVRGGTIENVFVRNIKTGQVADAVLLVDFYYEEGDKGQYPPTVRNIHMQNVNSNKSKFGIFAKGYERSPIRNITVEDCRWDNAARGNVLEHVDGLTVRNVTVNGLPFSPPAKVGSAADAAKSTFSAEPVFDSGFESNSAVDWTPTKGDWSVAEDAGNKVLVQGGPEEGRAQAGNPAWSDYRLQARIKAVETSGTTRVSLCGRYKDGNNFYAAMLTFRNGTDQIALRRKVGGSTVTLASQPVELSVGQWHEVTLEMQGGAIKASLDGRPVLSVTDDQLKQGGIGLVSRGWKIYFDDIKAAPIAGR